MLKLREVELSGFKSFADRTKIEVRSDLLIVVGPNGSGKSNIADAILWAIGEQSAKSLRGSKMQDVIFGGTKKRPSSGTAEVSLTFEKGDGQKTKIGRRLTRGGESSYIIDDGPVRLKDVHEFCYKNNISVQGSFLVEQGRVEAILAMSPEERKLLFEEVAGIAHYKENRKTAESKLAGTQNNLLRLNDIMTEINSELDGLKKQALKAERYIRLSEELKDKQRSFFGRGLSRLLSRKNLLESELTLFYDEKEKRSASLSSVESGLEALKLKKNDEEAAFSKITDRLYELEISKERKEQDNKRKFDQILAARDRIRVIEEDSGTLLQKEKERKKALALLDEKKSGNIERAKVLKDEVEKAGERVRGFKSKLDKVLEDIEAKRKANFSFAEEKSSKKSLLGKVSEECKKLAEREARHKREKEKLASDRDKAEAALVDEEAALLQKGNRLSEKDDELLKIQKDFDSLRKKISEAVKNMSFVEKNIASSESTIRVLTEQERLQKSKTKDLLEKKAKIPEKSKIPSMLGEISKKTLKAIEMVLGEALLGYKVENAGAATSLIEEISGEITERIAFLSPDLSETRKILKDEMKTFKSFQGFVDEMEGFPAWLKNHIRKTARFSDNDEAFAFTKKSGLPSLINDSILVNPEGWILGGPAKELFIPLLKIGKENDEAKKKLKLEKETAAGLNESLLTLRKREKEISLIESQLKAEREKIQSDLQEVKLSYQNAQGELNRINGYVDLNHMEESDLKRSKEELDAEKEKLEKRLKQLEKEIAETEASFSLLEDGGTKLAAEVEKAGEALTEKRMEEQKWQEKYNSLETEIEGLNNSIYEVISSRERIEDEKGLLLQKARKFETGIREEENNLTEVLEEINRTKEKRRTHEETIKTLEEEKMRSEKSVREARETLSEVQAEISEREKELAAVDADHKNMLERFSSCFEEDWRDLAKEWENAPQMTVEERESSYGQIIRIEKRLNEMGPQNLLAKEEYETKSKRLNFQNEQKKDLEAAISQLQETIKKINETIRSRYKEAFEAVNQSFTQLFKVVFDGGEAYLTLEDSENPLESGIEIFAQPPGKKLQNINLLSGGEKALVALTLLFAILSFRPQPFFLLDEIDAPLDDANIERVLSKMLLEFSQKTQFMVVSHNKRTMELGDVIYGVTMEESGISKVVSVSLKEVAGLN